MSNTGAVINSSGRIAFTVAGSFGSGILIRFNPGHPSGTNYVVSATPRGAASLWVSYTPNFPGERAFFFRNASNANVASELSFTIF